MRAPKNKPVPRMPTQGFRPRASGKLTRRPTRAPGEHRVDASRGGSSEECDGETAAEGFEKHLSGAPGYAAKNCDGDTVQAPEDSSLWMNQSALTPQRRASAESDGLGIVWQPRGNRECVGSGEVSCASVDVVKNASSLL